MSLNYLLFDTLLEPVFILDSSKRIVYCNETAAVILSSTPRKLIRTQAVLTDVFQFSEPIEGLDSLASVVDPTAYKEVNFTTTDGNSGKIQITIQKLPDVDNWITFIRDVTLEERLQKKYRAELDAKEGVIDELKKAQAELENYSRNLEKMVEERTAEIRGLNQKLKALLDSLDQGFLIFDQTGHCWEVTSKACEDVLETRPAGQKIWDVLKLPPKQQDGFSKWLTTLFMEMLPFEDLVGLGPQKYQHSKGKHIELDYYPIRNSDKQIEALVLVASDITSLVEAQEQAEKEKAHAGFILKMFQQKRSFLSFYEESQNLMAELESLTAQSHTEWNKESLFRVLHTLKGGSASYSVRDVAAVTHELESGISRLIEDPSSFNPDRWNELTTQLKQQYEKFKHEVQELLGSTTQSHVQKIEVPKPELSQILDLLESWAKTKHWAQSLKSQYLTEPLQMSFDSYNYLVQKTAEQLHKKVSPLIFENPDFRWNYDPYKSFMTSLVHVFRNAIDHGLETPEERVSAGKPEVGEIRIHASETETAYEIKIADDGRGLNIFRIKQRMTEKGMDPQGLTTEQIALQIFEPQFSTKTEVTDLSGRGVGLDAVKHEVEKLGGHISLKFEENKGTAFIFHLPKKKETASDKKAA